MTLNRRIALILLLIAAGCVGAVALLQQFVILPPFQDLERREAQRDLQRGTEALQRELFHLGSLCHDWGSWDDTYRYVAAPNRAFEESTLTAESFRSAQVNLLFILRPDGGVVWGAVYDLDTLEPIADHGFPLAAWPLDAAMLRLPRELPLDRQQLTDVLETPRGPILVCSRPILTSNNTGPSAGILVMGRYLTPGVVRALAEQTRVDLSILATDASALTAEDREVLARLDRGGADEVREADADTLRAWTVFRDRAGRAQLLVRARVPRDVSARGLEVARYGLLTSLLASLLVMAVGTLLNLRFVVRPISRLTRQVVAAGRSDAPVPAFPRDRTDEIGVLAREFHTTLAKLAEARERLQEQSYYAGMAELAEGILHNVRNQITPLFGDLDLLREKLRKVPLERLEACRQELAEGTPDTARRRDLEQLIELGGQNALTTLVELIRDFDGLAQRLADVERVLERNERFTRVQRPAETLVLREVLEEARSLLPREARETVEIEVAPDTGNADRVHAPRVPLLQVCVELLFNAAESMRRAGRSRGTVILHAAPAVEKDRSFVQVRLEDDGAGMGEETLQRLFQRGFSTRRPSGGGLGLHWCANTLAAWGGRIRAESEGHGKGATFHLELPAPPPDDGGVR